MIKPKGSYNDQHQIIEIERLNPKDQTMINIKSSKSNDQGSQKQYLTVQVFEESKHVHCQVFKSAMMKEKEWKQKCKTQHTCSHSLPHIFTHVNERERQTDRAREKANARHTDKDKVCDGVTTFVETNLLRSDFFHLSKDQHPCEH
eukprot:m.218977 g.218977  ORF g.218977 m.218977 type:complete len:146 (+) comp33284_c1_seq1:85-522(+)